MELGGIFLPFFVHSIVYKSLQVRSGQTAPQIMTGQSRVGQGSKGSLAMWAEQSTKVGEAD